MKNILASIMLLTTSTFLGQTTLTLASDVWPPFTDITPKHAFALDLVHEALARSNVPAETHILDFKEVITSIKDKEFDGSAALWYSEEREKYLLFSEPYLENRLILVGKKGSAVDADTLSELKGKRIAVVESYAYGSVLEQGGKIVLVKGKSDQQNIERLLKGEVDYLLADALLIEYLLQYQSEEATSHLEIGTRALLRLPLYFALRREIPGAEKIIKNFNEEVKKMITEGTYNRILQLNWLASDVDGDGLPELVLGGDKAGTQAPSHSYGVKTPSGNDKVNRYMIEGTVYPNWESVPEKYKVPPPIATGAEKKGFGPVFKF